MTGTMTTTTAPQRTGIVYCNGGLAAAEAVADFAVAMVISTFRHLPWAICPPRRSPTSHTRHPHPHPSLHLHTHPHPPPAQTPRQPSSISHEHTAHHSHHPGRHVLGLAGLGNTGQQIAAKLGNPSTGMPVHYHDVAARKRSPPLSLFPAEERGLGVAWRRRRRRRRFTISSAGS